LPASKPQVVSDALLGALGAGSEVHLEQLALDDAVLRSLDRIAIVACGTSWHAGLVTEVWLERFARITTEVDYASEFRYRDPVLDSRTGVIAISQSGETADTLAALRRAKVDFNARTLGICNVQGSTIARECDGLAMDARGAGNRRRIDEGVHGPTRRRVPFRAPARGGRGTMSAHEMRRLTDQLRRLPNGFRKPSRSRTPCAAWPRR
jgi:glucosamine 6-phosphate synthetase-like amidotransferase/phosphosugar isomerase protein